MQFMITAQDGFDEHAPNRRLAVRDAHVARSDELAQTGNMLFGVAFLDEHDRIVGSVMFVDFPDRAGVAAWLQTEPYVTGGVWQTIHAKRCRVGPSFSALATASADCSRSTPTVIGNPRCARRRIRSRSAGL